MANGLITQEELKRQLLYDPQTGVFIWLVPISNIRAGDVAGSIDHEGYRIISINSKRYRANRLAWFYVHGVWPEGEIDHKSRNKGEDRIDNLRPATTSQNQCNRGKQRNNTSGHKGVNWHKPTKKWEAKLNVKGTKIHLGYFANLEVAAKTYADAALKYHGEFAHNG